MRSGRVWLAGAFPASGDSRARLLLRSCCFAVCPTCHPGDTRRLQGAGGASASPRTSPVRSSAGPAPGGCLRVCCFSAGDDNARGGQGGWDVQLGSPPVPRKKKQVLGAAILCTALGLWAIYLMCLDLCFFSQGRQGIVSLRCPDPSEVPRTASGRGVGAPGCSYASSFKSSWFLSCWFSRPAGKAWRTRIQGRIQPALARCGTLCPPWSSLHDGVRHSERMPLQVGEKASFGKKPKFPDLIKSFHRCLGLLPGTCFKCILSFPS